MQIRFLAVKSIRTILRQKNMLKLITLSCFFVFSALYGIWVLTKSKTLTFMTSNYYSRLEFDVVCSVGDIPNKKSSCSPVKQESEGEGADKAPADLFFELLHSQSSSEQTGEIARLLSSLMMNGLPLLGLDDFIHFSDLVRRNLGTHKLKQMMRYPAYQDKFGNFLNIREKELRFVPQNCWTEEFIHALNRSSHLLRNLKVSIYPDMETAVAPPHCCNDIWAVVEILPPLIVTRSSHKQHVFSCTDLRKKRDTWPHGPKASSEAEVEAGDLKSPRGSMLDDGKETSREGKSGVYPWNDDKDNLGRTPKSNDSLVKVRVGPTVTIRMLPQAIPDTRNFEWSPRKIILPREESGQIMYFVSGFLTLQLEIQNFLSIVGLGGPLLTTHIFDSLNNTGSGEGIDNPSRGEDLDSDTTVHSPAVELQVEGEKEESAELEYESATDALKSPTAPKESPTSSSNAMSSLFPDSATRSVADVILHAREMGEVFAALVNSTKKSKASYSPTIHVPVYNKAFPTHKYLLAAYWRTFAQLMVTTLVIFFSMPAAVVSGYFRKEADGGQLDVLSTIPGFRASHNAAAWCLTGALWVAFLFLACCMFFHLTLTNTAFWVPSLNLFISGVALCPLAMILGTFVKRPDALVVTVPVAVFVTMLPGLLYVDLAYDVQRTVWTELLLCMLPSSGGALILRHIFSLEAMGVAADWMSPAPVSKVPIFANMLVVIFCLLFYSVLSMQRIDAAHSMSNQNVIVKSSSSSASLEANPSLSSWAQAMALLKRPLVVGLHIVDSLAAILWVFRSPCNDDLRNSASMDELANLTTDSPFMRTVPGHVPIREGQGSIVMEIDSLSKRYKHLTDSGTNDRVLSNVSTELRSGEVVCLLGSNGAGKTTLMRILGGLDIEHGGFINVLGDNIPRHRRHDRILEHKEASRRIIGWCPQNDALFENLTVKENLELFLMLLARDQRWWMSDIAASGDFSNPYSDTAPTCSSRSLAYSESLLTSMLASLGMENHISKRASDLSGGMKRRLSLLLAFVGEPSILLLDEPTSGCDSWTRELVRKEILARRDIDQASVLVSTHHIDDVEVVGDRVWFLNDKYLEYDGPLSALRYGSGDIGTTAISRMPEYRVFVAASDPEIKTKIGKLFQVEIRRGEAHCNEDESSHSKHSSAIWSLSNSHTAKMSACLAEFEATGLLNWAVTSPSIDDSLIKMYGIREDERQFSAESATSTSSVPEDFVGAEMCKDNQSAKILPVNPSGRRSVSDRFISAASSTVAVFRQVVALLGVRYLATKANKKTFILIQIVFPFIFALTLARFCGIVSFPKTQLNSKFIGEVGEVCVSLSPFSNASATIASRYGGGRYGRGGSGVPPVKHLPSMHHYNRSASSFTHNILQSSLTDTEASREYPGGYNALLSMMGHAVLSWKKSMSSDEMWAALFEDYYYHPRTRYGSFVLNDTIPDWAESTVFIKTLPLRGNFSTSGLYNEILRAQEFMCAGSSVSSEVTTAAAENHLLDGSSEKNIFDGEEMSSEKFISDRGVSSSSSSPVPDIRKDSSDNGVALAGSDMTVKTRKHGNSDNNEAVKGHEAKKIPVSASSHEDYSHSPLCQIRVYIVSSSDVESHNKHSPSTRTNSSKAACGEKLGPKGDSNKGGESYVAISAVKSLHANVTMLTNVTNDHATPVFLKEIVPLLFSSLQYIDNRQSGTRKESFPFSSESVDKEDQSAAEALFTVNIGANMSHSLRAQNTPAYELFTFPLPKFDFNNLIYIERGYLGAHMIVLYIMITTITSVRFITHVRKKGVKLQFHIAGVHPVTYWIANFLWDSFIVYLTMAAVLAGIYVGGQPVYSFFFRFYDLLLPCIISFSFAVVSSSYACNVHSSDDLHSVLFLLMLTICNGVVLKLFLERHPEYPYSLLSKTLQWISPSFAFATAMFEMFLLYTKEFSLKLGASILITSAKDLESIKHMVMVMKLQCVGYLVLTIAIDYFWVRLEASTLRCYVIISSVLQRVWKYLPSICNSRFASSESTFAARINNRDGSSILISSQSTRLLPVGKKSSRGTNRNGFHFSEYGALLKTQPFTASGSGVGTVTSNWDDVAVGPGILRTLSGADAVLMFSDLDEVQYAELARRRSASISAPVSASASIEQRRSRSGTATSYTSLVGQALSTPLEYSASDLENGGSENGGHDDAGPDLPRTSKDLVKIRNVTMAYSRQSSSRFSLDNLSTSIRRGERVALLGLNGGGKSSLFKILALASNVPLGGSVLINNRNLLTDMWGVCREKVLGYVPQEEGLLDFLTVAESINLFKAMRGAKTIPPSVLGIIPSRYLDYPVRSLSGGNKKKLSVLLSRIGDPSLLLLDECTSGVDPVAADLIVQHLRFSSTTRSSSSTGNNNAQSMLFTSHRIDECVSICDRVILLNDGNVDFDGSVHAFDNIAHLFYQIDVVFQARDGNQEEHGNCYNYSDSDLYNETPYSDLFELSRGRKDTAELIRGSLSRLFSYLASVLTDKKLDNDNECVDGLDANYYGNRVKKKLLLQVERVTVYSSSFARITFEKERAPLSRVWQGLDALLRGDKGGEEEGGSGGLPESSPLLSGRKGAATPRSPPLLQRFAFRAMSMEETLAIVIESANKKRRKRAVRGALI